MLFSLPHKKPISKNRQIKREVKHTRSLLEDGTIGLDFLWDFLWDFNMHLMTVSQARCNNYHSASNTQHTTKHQITNNHLIII